jgi:hypothetical protein
LSCETNFVFHLEVKVEDTEEDVEITDDIEESEPIEEQKTLNELKSHVPTAAEKNLLHPHRGKDEPNADHKNEKEDGMVEVSENGKEESDGSADNDDTAQVSISTASNHFDVLNLSHQDSPQNQPNAVGDMNTNEEVC